MRTDLSIRRVFTKNQEELFALCQNRAQFIQLQQKVDELLNSDELKDNKSVLDAKIIFNNCKVNYNRYVSTLMTYLTGMKVR